MSLNKPRKSHLPDRHVLFHDDVVVHNFDIDDNDVVRRKNPALQMMTNNSSNNVSNLNFDRRKPPSSYSVSLPPEKNVVQYSLVRDRLQRQIVLQFSVPIGPMYGPKGVMVKANLHGTKIRVMACSKRPTKAADGQTVKMEYNETFALPLAIDPNRVTARVDNLGYLMIGAPIIKEAV